MPCPNCGENRFFAKQIIYLEPGKQEVDVIVSDQNNFLENVDTDDFEEVVKDASSPFGPYVCCTCSEEFDSLPKSTPSNKKSNQLKCRSCGNTQVFHGFWQEEFSGKIRVLSDGGLDVSGGDFQRVVKETIDIHRCGKCHSEDIGTDEHVN